MPHLTPRNADRNRPGPRLMRLEDRFSPGSVFGDPLAAAIPAQIAGLMSQSTDVIRPSSSLTLVNHPQADAPPAVDPGVTLFSSPAATDAALVVVAAALMQPNNVPVPPSVGDELFANFTPSTPLAPPPAVPAPTPDPTNTQSGNGGGSTSLVTTPPAPPGPGAPPAGPTNPPPIVPPPGMNPPAPPVANADSYNVVGGTIAASVATGVLANDTNPTGQPITAQLMTSTVFGMVVLNANGSFTYTASANPGVAFTDSFSYVATAGGLWSNTATVTLNIAGPAAPTANDDSYAVINGTLSVPASGVLANDTNPGTLPMTATMVAFAGHGTAVLNSDGSFTYAANAGFTGTDSFTYQVTAGGSPSNIATVTLNVMPSTPVGPTANDDVFTVQVGGTLTLDASNGVLANDVTSNGQPMTAVLVTTTANGALTLGQDGSVSYAPNATSPGFDSFTYEVTAGGHVSNVATVAINVVAPPPSGGTLTLTNPGSQTNAEGDTVSLQIQGNSLIDLGRMRQSEYTG